MFETLRRNLEERTQPLRIFFRDDDADSDIPELRRLVNLFDRHQAPVSLAVIPASLTPECAEVLLRARPLVETHQHGWMHANHEPFGRKCEFGPSRAFEQQLVDIARGAERLNDMLGASWTRAFTPPWNRCTDATFNALDALGFQVLSRDVTALPATGRRFREISVNVDLFRWKGERRLKSEEEISAACCASVGPAGVLLHHKVMDDTAFELLDSLLTALRQSGAVHFHTLASLLKEEPA